MEHNYNTNEHINPNHSKSLEPKRVATFDVYVDFTWIEEEGEQVELFQLREDTDPAALYHGIDGAIKAGELPQIAFHINTGDYYESVENVHTTEAVSTASVGIADYTDAEDNTHRGYVSEFIQGIFNDGYPDPIVFSLDIKEQTLVLGAYNLIGQRDLYRSIVPPEDQDTQGEE